MKEPFTVEQVKKMYFSQFDEISWYIEHDKFKINSILFNSSRYNFINTVEIKKEWEKVIDEIQKEIVNNL